jgi:hypothetical protein
MTLRGLVGASQALLLEEFREAGMSPAAAEQALGRVLVPETEAERIRRLERESSDQLRSLSRQMGQQGQVVTPR